MHQPTFFCDQDHAADPERMSHWCSEHEAQIRAYCLMPNHLIAVHKTAINLGDDADTTGAVCGQLAGAHWGESGIPQEWLEGLARKEMIEEALAGLRAGRL